MTSHPARVTDEPQVPPRAGENAPPGDHQPAGAVVGLLRAAIGPVLAAALLIGLLSAWTLTGGAGTLRRVHVEITLAAIPLSFAPGAGDGLPDAVTYLEIRNIGSADDLVGARSPMARGTLLVRDGRSPLAADGQLSEIAFPAGATIDLSPFGLDLVLLHPRALHIGEIVPITLEFRDGGPVRVNLLVTSSLASP